MEWFSVGIELVFFHTVNQFIFGMKTVIAQFVLYPEEDEKDTCHTEGEPEDIEYSDAFVFQEQAQCESYAVANHVWNFSGFGIKTNEK